MKPAGRMKFPTFGDRDVSTGGNGGNSEKGGWIPREKYPEFPMESPKEKEKDGGKVYRCFLLIFSWGGGRSLKLRGGDAVVLLQ